MGEDGFDHCCAARDVLAHGLAVRGDPRVHNHVTSSFQKIGLFQFPQSEQHQAAPLPRLDQHEVGMVNATLDVAGDGDQPPLRIEDFQ